MIQQTSSYRTRFAAGAVAQPSNAAFPFTCLAVAFGVIAGVAVAGILIPVMVQTVIPAVVRAMTGA